MSYEWEAIFMDISAENEKCMQNLLCNIRLLRLEAGLSVKEMANIVGMEESLLLRLEAGEQADEFDSGHIFRYCHYFHVHPNELFGGWPIRRNAPPEP